MINISRPMIWDNLKSFITITIVGYPVWDIKDKLPESILNITNRSCKAFCEVNRSTFISQPIEDLSELKLGFGSFNLPLIMLLLYKHVSFVVTIEAPMILVKWTHSHSFASVYLDSFHV